MLFAAFAAAPKRFGGATAHAANRSRQSPTADASEASSPAPAWCSEASSSSPPPPPPPPPPLASPPPPPPSSPPPPRRTAGRRSMTRSTVRSAATSRFRSSRDACWHSDSATLTEKKTFPSTRERPKQRRTLSKISLAAISPRPRPTVTTKCRVWSGIGGGGVGRCGCLRCAHVCALVFAR